MRLRAAGTAVGRAAVAGMLGVLGVAAAASPAARAAASITDVSQNCAGQNAEVEEATAPPGYIYQVWIGCGGIGYARSTDGGATYSVGVEMPGSGGAWDPAVAVGPTGIVYVAYMLSSGESPRRARRPPETPGRFSGAGTSTLRPAGGRA